MCSRFVAFGLTLLWLSWAPLVHADTTISLEDAVRQGKVKVDVKSRGGAAGKTVRVEVQRLVPESLKIEVTPGTVLINSVNTEQNLTVGRLVGRFTRGNYYKPGSVMVLADNNKRSFLLEVYCLDYAKKGVRKDGALQLAIQDKRVARILNAPPGLKPTVGAVQIAIWMDRAGIAADVAMKRCRGATEGDIEIARQLLVHAEKTGIESLPDDMPASVKVHVEKLFSPDPKIRTAAAAVIGRMGGDARSAVSFLTENLLDRSTDKPLPASVVSVDVDAALGTAADALQRLQMPGLNPLIDSLREGTQVPAAKKAVGLVGEIMVDTLIGRLKSGRAAVRERTIRVLVGTGSDRAIQPLIDLLEDDSESVRAAAAEGLKALTNQDFGTDVQRWRKWLSDR